jgi:hypothetical protein
MCILLVKVSHKNIYASELLQKKQKSKLHILHLGFCSISLKIAKTNCYKMIEIKKTQQKKIRSPLD